MSAGSTRGSAFLRLVCHLALIGLPRPVGAQAQVLVQGVVVDGFDRPVFGAEVRVVDDASSVLTTDAGTFRLPGVPAGELLLIRALGYADTALAATPDMRIVLREAPIWLEGVSVSAPRREPLTATVTGRSITAAPSLGEPDVFRAILSIPHATQPNDLKGRVHLAGGGSDEVGLYLDGHPLQDPTHLLGLFGAVNPRGLERADVQMGYVDPARAGTLAGAIDFQTLRSGEGRHSGGVGLVAANWTSLWQPVAGTNALVSARATYLDRLADLSGIDVPLIGFHDLLVRVGRSTSVRSIDAVFFHTRDRLIDADLRGGESYEPARWGETLVGLTAATSLAGIRVTGRGSFDRFGTGYREGGGSPDSVSISRTRVSGSLDVAWSAADRSARIGASASHRSNEQAWYAPGLAADLFAPTTPHAHASDESALELRLYAEASAELARLRIRPGLGAVTAGSAWYLAPSLTLTADVTDDVLVEGSAGRRHQFHAQLSNPVEGTVTLPEFLLSTPRVADVVSLAGLYRGAYGEARVSGFFTRYPNRVELDGDTADYPTFRQSAGESYGLGATLVLHPVDQSLLQLSYSFQRAFYDTDTGRVPTDWDTPHSFNVLALHPVRNGWVVTATYTARTGVPATPVEMRLLDPSVGPRYEPRYILGERNSVRVPSYHRVDVGLRRAWRSERRTYSLSIDVINVLNRRNLIAYEWDDYFRSLLTGSGDRGRTALPVVPSLSFQVEF